MSSKKDDENIQKNVYNKKYGRYPQLVSKHGETKNDPKGEKHIMLLAPICWEGDSREVVSSFPKEIKEDIGYALWQLQKGEIPKSIRSMKSVGAGVFEIRESDERAWYRVIYLSKHKGTIYVLHGFEKKTRKTEKQDLETARLRMVRVTQQLAEEARNEKRKEKGRSPKRKE